MEQSLAGFGVIPILHKILAEAPATYKAYNQTFTSFMKGTTFSPLEQQVVFMTSNFENNCHYCVPGHAWMMKSSKMSDDVIDALKNGMALPDAKLQARHDFTKAQLNNRGHIGDDKLNEFLNTAIEFY